MVMNTMIFYTYFLMNMFNQINCRVIDDNELNPFRTLFNNTIFWIVFGVEMGVTHFMLFLARSSLGTAVLGMTTISLTQYIIAVFLGALSIPLFALTKKVIPMGPFEKLSRRIDLEQEMDIIDPLAKTRELVNSQRFEQEDESPMPKEKAETPYGEDDWPDMDKAEANDD